jgi:glucose/arabinose dehydrogenase
MRYLSHLILATVLLAPVPGRAADYQLERAFPSLTFTLPTDIQSPPDGSNRMFVVEKRGVIKVFPARFETQPGEVTEFLNLTGKVRASGEAGALGLAFHPDYAHNGTFFVFWVSNYPHRCIVARYQVSADPNVADASSETLLLDVPKVTQFHNGGQIAFGSDGYLYVGLGEDQVGAHAQDLTDLRGSILRIDVDATGGPGAPYGIPPDNPYAGNGLGYREEIFAYGFRNPWRFSLDALSGELWVADVGEDTWEEIDLVTRGRNYGWPYVEGPACLDPGQCAALGPALTAPLYSYDHSEGVAVIGGRRYWGPRLPELAGLYVFADYTGGTVWGLRFDGAGPPERFDLVTGAPALLTFGEGPTHELYVASVDGSLYRLSRTVTAVRRDPAAPASRLLGNFPNPFNPATTIRYETAAAGRVEIDIFAAGGEHVRRVVAEDSAAGPNTAAWRGDTEHGTRAASGVYIVRLRVDGVAVDTQRMVLLK